MRRSRRGISLPFASLMVRVLNVSGEGDDTAVAGNSGEKTSKTPAVRS
jgi:hypothetical protein